MEFETKEDLKKYLEKHPNANKSRHYVKNKMHLRRPLEKNLDKSWINKNKLMKNL